MFTWAASILQQSRSESTHRSYTHGLGPTVFHARHSVQNVTATSHKHRCFWIANAYVGNVQLSSQPLTVTPPV